MLVLTRKVNEEIVIQVAGHEIVIMPTDIRTERVRIGIKAPDEVQIWRREVLAERLAAAAANTAAAANYVACDASTPVYFSGVENGFIGASIDVAKAARFPSREVALQMEISGAEPIQVGPHTWALRLPDRVAGNTAAGGEPRAEAA